MSIAHLAKPEQAADDRLVKVEPAAKAIGVSIFWLYKRAKDLSRPCYRQGKLLRFSIQELRDAMRQAGKEAVGDQ